MVHFIEQRFLKKFKSKHALRNQRSAITLLSIQGALIVVLIVFLSIMFFTSDDARHRFYIPLISLLFLILIIAIYLNSRGRYQVSTWLTVISVIIAPWISILLDPAVGQGDLIPVLYVGLSVQGCSILLKEKWVIWIATAEMLAVLTILRTMAKTTDLNWLSLFAFILSTSAIAVSYGYTNRKQLEQIHDLSVRDSLTGLFNRRYMEETFDREIGRVLRKGLKLAVIMTDVDYFKTINDIYGHVAGDLVLARVAHLLTSNIRSSDVACRYGGDEFILILPECTKQEAVQRAEVIRKMVSQTTLDHEGKYIKDITLSFGIAELPENGKSRSELICAADQALYLSKQSGRNRVS